MTTTVTASYDQVAPPNFLFSPSVFPLLQAAPACRIHSAYRKEGRGGIINPPSWAGSVMAQPEYMDWYRPRP